MKQKQKSNQTSVPQYHRMSPSYGTHTFISSNKSRSVIAKLLAFTAAMIVLPIGSYFASVNMVFKGLFAADAWGIHDKRSDMKAGNATYAGALAALMANVVLIGYVVVAFRDDKQEREAEEEERKKQR